MAWKGIIFLNARYSIQNYAAKTTPAFFIAFLHGLS